jgi:hypothetical protein
VTLPALFVLAEWLRGWMFTGFGWLAAGYSQTDSWLMGYAPLGGILAMSLAVLVTSGALLTLVLGSLRERAAAGAVLAVVWAGGLAADAHSFTEPKERDLGVALAQGNIAQTLKYEPEQLRPMMALYAELTRQGAGADLVIWPEAAIPTYLEYIEDYAEAVRRAAAAQGSTVLLGILQPAPHAKTIEEFQNILVALTDEPQVYVKRHLVPFGEFYRAAFIRTGCGMNLPTGDAIQARPTSRRSAWPAKVAVTICYGDVFGAERALSRRGLAARQRQQRRVVRRFDRAASAPSDRARARGRGGAILAARHEHRRHGRHRSEGARRGFAAAISHQHPQGDRSRLHGRDAVRARRQLSRRASVRDCGGRRARLRETQPPVPSVRHVRQDRGGRCSTAGPVST